MLAQQTVSCFLSLRPSRGHPDTPFPIMSSGQVVNAPLTLDSVLSRYTSTPNPPMAALEQVISERNILSSQNSQLWKLVEKQRSGYSQIWKELERVRSERDTFKARLILLGENTDEILRKKKASKWGRPGNALKPPPPQAGLRSDGRPPPEDPRQAMAKNQSEDPGMRCVRILWRTSPIYPLYSSMDPHGTFTQRPGSPNHPRPS